MKPRIWRASGCWICQWPHRPHRWAMGDTPLEAYEALMART